MFPTTTGGRGRREDHPPSKRRNSNRTGLSTHQHDWSCHAPNQREGRNSIGLINYGGQLYCLIPPLNAAQILIENFS